ncbi:hypothetical protein [Leuconostoc mesenteroides]|uniref:hypothetical protein n=1 Tax=Leuconostoc mesenteroides TaxID=1245 RepID=UPI0010ADB97C|nr:hypothetical protein [Leuconostoc mesenteroides]TJY30579.1 hypothetical protein FCF26_05060 [Leuconostoc mesenteroides subsp. mesenteroides]
MEEFEYAKKFDLTHVFIKFIDSDHVEAFMKKGELHFEKFSNFNEMTDFESGDPNEGSVALALKKAKATIKLPSGKQSKIFRDVNIEDVNMQYANDVLKNYGLTSMFYVNQLDGFDVEPINETNYPYDNTEGFEAVGKINNKVLDKFSSFLSVEHNKSKVPVLIFPNNIIKRFQEKNIPILRDKVEYYDIHDASFFEKIRSDDIIKTLFVKTDNYAHQKEYRFVLPEVIPNCGKNVYLGNMEDIAIRLDKENLENYRAYYKNEKHPTRN